LLPAVQNLGPLGGGLLAGLIVVIIGLGGFFLGRRKIKLGSTNGSDLLPAVQKGGLESDALINHEIGGTTRPPGPPIMPNDVLIPPGPPNTPSDVIKPPGPPVMPNNVLRPPGPPTMPSDVMQPPGPPVMPNESMKPPGPPTKPPNPNKGGGLKHQ